MAKALNAAFIPPLQSMHIKRIIGALQLGSLMSHCDRITQGIIQEMGVQCLIWADELLINFPEPRLHIERLLRRGKMMSQTKMEATEHETHQGDYNR
jgi:hypothetical protein